MFPEMREDRYGKNAVDYDVDGSGAYQREKYAPSQTQQETAHHTDEPRHTDGPEIYLLCV